MLDPGEDVFCRTVKLDFKEFCEAYQPLIRPERTEERMRAAFQVDARFVGEFRHLKPLLPSKDGSWGESILYHLMKMDMLDVEFTQDEISIIRALYRDHSAVFRSGVFDERYLDSIEKIALFFVLHDIKTIWIASAYQATTRNLVEKVFKVARYNRSVPANQLINSLVCAMSLELNQIQRTFTVYERHVSESLVQDLTYGGVLTSFPTGKSVAGQAAMAAQTDEAETDVPEDMENGEAL